MKHCFVFLCVLIYNISHGQESEIRQLVTHSKFLNEQRILTIYIPGDFNPSEEYDAIFCSDGQFINEQYKIKLDSLFLIQSIAPFVIIGVNSNETKAPNNYLEYRNYEYLESLSGEEELLSSRFRNHLNFFVKEVEDSVAAKLNLKIKNKYFYGVSNGAAFGISLSKYYPKFFTKYILYSIMGMEYEDLKWNIPNPPFFIIAYGNQESLIERDNQALSEYLNENGYKHSIRTYDGGHKREDWLTQFIKDILQL